MPQTKDPASVNRLLPLKLNGEKWQRVFSSYFLPNDSHNHFPLGSDSINCLAMLLALLRTIATLEHTNHPIYTPISLFNGDLKVICVMNNDSAKVIIS